MHYAKIVVYNCCTRVKEKSEGKFIFDQKKFLSLRNLPSKGSFSSAYFPCLEY